MNSSAWVSAVSYTHLDVYKRQGRENAPLLFRLRWDPALFDWSLRFLRECTPQRTRANIRDIVSLALYSRSRLQALRDETSIEYDHLERGILHVYTCLLYTSRCV